MFAGGNTFGTSTAPARRRLWSIALLTLRGIQLRTLGGPSVVTSPVPFWTAVVAYKLSTGGTVTVDPE